MVLVTESALGRTGFFSEPPSLAAGDPYTGVQEVELPRHKGVQMKIAFPKIGGTPDALFDKTHKPLQDGIMFMDEYRIERRKDVELQKTLAGKKAFVPSSPSKKATGPGSTIGCLGTIPLGLKPQESAGEGAGTSVPKKSASHLKNFYTNPSKKGGAGYDFAARTIGGKQPFGYITDEYQSGIRLTKEERKTMRARISKPFSAGGLVHHPIMAGRGDPPETKDKKKTEARSRTSDGDRPRPAFRPSSKVVGGQGIGYEYIPGGHLPVDAPRAASFKPFRTGGTQHTKYTRYINVYEAPPIPPPPPITDYS